MYEGLFEDFIMWRGNVNVLELLRVMSDKTEFLRE